MNRLHEQGHETRRRMLDFVRAYWKDRGYGPTFREVGASAGLTSLNSISDHLQRLANEGYVTYTPGVGRTLKATRKQMPDTLQ